jgi:tRNA-modifying protein YgfZ
MSHRLLTDRAVVRFAGADAEKLLNDTLTCRFDDGLDGAGRWFALLSPQGKVQVEGLVTRAGEAFWFVLPAALVADFVKRMKMYRLRAKVEIEPRPELAVVWSDGQSSADSGIAVFTDGRAAGLGRYRIVPTVESGSTESGEPASPNGAARIAAGIAEFGDFSVNEVFPHDIGMDLLEGIDFKKGCYIGQEVVSRMQYRGTARRRPVIVSGVPDGAGVGAPVMVGDREAGTIGEVVDGKAVAILRLDRINGEPVTIGGLPVELHLPQWATYKLGEPAAAEG